MDAVAAAAVAVVAVAVVAVAVVAVAARPLRQFPPTWLVYHLACWVIVAAI